MKTKEVVFNEGNVDNKLIIHYGMRKISNQEPCFSITCELYEKHNNFWKEIACGCLHDEISKHCPELKPLIKWHLCFEKKGPLSYIENGMFWWRRSKLTSTGKELYPSAIGTKALEHFKSTIVFGAIDTDSQYKDLILNTSIDDIDKIRSFLYHRFHRMMNAFYEDMMKFEIY